MRNYPVILSDVTAAEFSALMLTPPTDPGCLYRVDGLTTYRWSDVAAAWINHADEHSDLGDIPSFTFNGTKAKALLDVSGNDITLRNPQATFDLFDDFEGTWAIGDAGPADRWSSTAGSGTGNQVATTVANSIGGTITLKTASDDGVIAANGTTLTGINLAYQADQGGLMMEARMKLSDVSEAALFVGFTDTISTTIELPIFLVTTAIDSDATDACGVGYDVDGTTKQFFHGGVKANTDTTPAYSGAAPVDNTYFTVRVEVSAAGAVQGFINGTAIGAAVANAVTATTPLTPAIIVANRSANQVVATIDYIRIRQNR